MPMPKGMTAADNPRLARLDPEERRRRYQRILEVGVSQAARECGVDQACMSRLRERMERDAARGLTDDVPEGAVPPGHVLRGVSSLYTQNGRVAQWVKTKEGPSSEEAIEAIRDALAEYEPPRLSLPKPAARATDLLTNYFLPDIHAGQLSWARETGANYDLAAARAAVHEPLADLVRSSPMSARGVVVVLGDLLHADTSENVTPKSKHNLDVDSRYPKVLRAALEIVLDAVAVALQRHAEVELVVKAGNHDPDSAHAIRIAAEMAFRNEPRVIVRDDPSPWWVMQFGASMVVAHHGDGIKAETIRDYALDFDGGVMWGATRYRYGIYGDKHHTYAKELAGMTIEGLQAITARDAWHNRKGYRSRRSMTASVLHAERGELMRLRRRIED